MDRAVGQWTQLGLCIVFDIVGALSYMIPGVGELADIVWAPIQGMIAFSMFGAESWGLMWTVISVSEELLPFTDIFPSLTIGWILKEVL